MIEYCQVEYIKDKGVIATTDGEHIIASGEKFLEVFNKLGDTNWKMCGESIGRSYKLAGNENDFYYLSIFYFMREVAE